LSYSSFFSFFPLDPSYSRSLRLIISFVLPGSLAPLEYRERTVSLLPSRLRQMPDTYFSPDTDSRLVFFFLPPAPFLLPKREKSPSPLADSSFTSGDSSVMQPAQNFPSVLPRNKRARVARRSPPCCGSGLSPAGGFWQILFSSFFLPSSLFSTNPRFFKQSGALFPLLPIIEFFSTSSASF